MDVERVHIKPVSPDPGAAGRYSAPDEQASPDRDECAESPRHIDDRIEISETGRRTYQAHAVLQSIDFARQALDRLAPGGDPERAKQLAARIDSGYYRTPGVIDQVIARMVSAR